MIAPKPNAAIWTREHDRKLLALVAQCGPNLSRKIMAMELRLGGNGERRIIKRLRELKIEKGTRI